MAVEKTRIKERLKALYPGVNLSKERIEQISSRLAPKPADDAEDGAIDELINEANFYNPFADLAKEDDQKRTLLANQKPIPAPEPAPNPAPAPKADDDTPTWAKALMERVEKMETEKQQSSIQQKLATLLPKVPAVFYKGRIPKTEEELETAASEIEADYSALSQELKISQLPAGNYTPRGNPNGANVQEAPKEQVEARAKRLIKI